MLHERTVFSPPEASRGPARARRSRDRLGTDEVAFKLLPLCVRVSLSHISRGNGRDLCRSIALCRNVVLKLRTFV